jgi:regulator of sigma E protease
LDKFNIQPDLDPRPPEPENGMTPPPAGADGLPPNEAAPTLRDWLARNGFLLVLMIGVLIFVAWRLDFWSVAKVVLGLGLVIFIHELGHFAVAKWCDVHVETFSIGFGPALPGCSFQWGETMYKIALFPVGGYVKMVGEGADTEEGEDDPRSFKNKSVGQRMAIISAGVIMNALLACVCFVVAYLHGIDQSPAEVDLVEAGSPAWKKGLRPGDVITKIDDTSDPYFYDLLFVVTLSKKGQELDFTIERFGPSDKPEVLLKKIEPRRDKDDMRPVIGIAPPKQASLLTKRYGKNRSGPVFVNSPTEKAEPPFEFDDAIIATTDPDNPSQVTELREDPRNPGSGLRDYFQFGERMRRLAGKDMTIRVRRHGSDEIADIHVPPAYHYILGMRMKMGEIAAVRDGSSAEKAGVSPSRKDSGGRDVPGDVLKKVQVLTVANGKLRWLTWDNAEWDASAKPGQREVEVTDPRSTTPRVVRELDPLRLPHELAKWSRNQVSAQAFIELFDKNHDKALSREELSLPPDFDFDQLDANHDGKLDADEVAHLLKTVVVTVEHTPALDSEGHSGTENRDLKVEWDDAWHNDKEGAFNPLSPLAVSGLGIAYRVKTVVERVEPGSPADGKLQKNDVIKNIRFKERDPKTSKADWPRWGDEPDSDQWWAHADWTLQQDVVEIKEIALKVERDGTRLDDPVELEAVPDPNKDWPLDHRGLILMPDSRLQRADGVLQALGLGTERTYRNIIQNYLLLYGILSGRLSVKNLGGPIEIATSAYAIAGEDFYMLILYLGMISISLAVVNFLPIPVLDGGHMVFLIYEKLRGKPAPETARALATYIGLLLIVSLMLFVIYLDLKRRGWWF